MLKDRHVLVLGLGESGLAMAQWCARNGAAVRVADSRAAPPYLGELNRRVASAEFFSADFAAPAAKSLLDGIDLVAISPGLSPGLLLSIHARAQGIPVVGEIELFAHGLRALGVRERSRVIAITGTNGKTTTTALAGHLCRAAGKLTGVAGNISPAALAALMACEDTGKLPDIWVLELSSFQLETLQSLDAEAATVLNISDDHLDRYIDLDDYAAAKARIFSGNGVQVLNRQDERVRRMAIPGRRLISFGLDAPGNASDFGLRENRGEPWIVQGDKFLLPVSQLPFSGLHNAANAMAALALCAAVDADDGLQPVALLPGLRNFQGLPHRVERIAEIAGVTYYDDSKGTNVGATVAALEGLGGKVVVILGGDGKGQDFSPLKAAVAGHGRAAVLIGRDGAKIGEAIAGCGVPVLGASDMDAAVRAAAGAARPGDAVLLSPACASFDMFRNYEHRAEVFVAAVSRLGK
ncbi:MAG: UDP-N-acetylmuramoyl-L-alanine--D-glutamate ligase [Gammaproteobacteria bacterium]|nr:UDP-N-acetylmuramoyl-L-alanine--D-glutamate ligase [Gammaproteobacteria bacterium]MBU1645958.1 UDP-N-acetylmuramoyl-L-alanine--D-glutamate ligase [Gammaproteobacteria bacterium]MBU1972020.1 UDP-N-acetylmuramoyl-L-alanine--D-glutamate ligase [Gammaproteobacteria bacterium]